MVPVFTDLNSLIDELAVGVSELHNLIQQLFLLALQELLVLILNILPLVGPMLRKRSFLLGRSSPHFSSRYPLLGDLCPLLLLSNLVIELRDILCQCSISLLQLLDHLGVAGAVASYSAFLLFHAGCEVIDILLEYQHFMLLIGESTFHLPAPIL